MGAIAGRRARSNKAANTQQAATRIAIEMRRIIIFFVPSVPEFPLEGDFTHHIWLRGAHNVNVGIRGTRPHNVCACGLVVRW